MKKEEEAPFLKSWSNLYWFVVGMLVMMILLFYWITQHYK